MTYELHPLATLFPPMSDEQYQALRDSIELRGQREPIRLHGGLVLDGRHRLRACNELGIEPAAVTLADDDDPLEYVLDANADRRDLKTSQRAMIAARLSADSGWGGDRRSSDFQVQNFELDVKTATKRLGSNHQSVADARRLLESGEIDLISECDAGMGISKNAAILDARLKAREEAEAKLSAERAALEVERERLAALAAREQAEAEAKTKAEADRQARRQRERQASERKAEAMAVAVRNDLALHHCAVADLYQHVDAGSVDLIFTDPPYEADALDAYGELATFAAHALKPGGIMLVLSGQTYLPAVLYELTTDEAIRYVWTIAYDMPGGSVMANKAHAHCNWKPLILLCKGDYAGEWYSDRLTVPPLQNQENDLHRWQQQEVGITEALKKWATPGLVVCDPFVGAGTTGVAAQALGCGFIGADIDTDALAKTRERLKG